MGIKLIALDLDGTLLQPDKTISREDREAIKWAAQQNIDVVIATGRSIGIVPPDAFTIPEIRYLITSNGAVLSDKKRGILSRRPIEEEPMHRIMDAIKDMDEMYEFFMEGVSYTQRKYYDQIESALREKRDPYFYVYHREPIDDYRAFVAKNAGHIELMCINYSRGEDPRVKSGLQSIITSIPGIMVTTSLPFDLEIVSDRAGKGKTLMRLGDILGINKNEIMAVGDSLNDREMLREAGVGVVMGNGYAELQQEADFVTKTNKENGVAHAIYEMVNKYK